MAITTFTPARAPNVIDGQTSQTTARTLVAQFGDGYSQRAGDGLNAIGSTVTLNWVNLTKVQADAIEAFFAARGGYEAFLYAVPCLTDERKWIAQSWSRTKRLSNRQSITATFEQVFDL